MGLGESHWSIGNKLEKEEKYQEALEHYLKEAEVQKQKKNNAMAALSLLSAAKCALKIKDNKAASTLFDLAGDSYIEYAETTSSISPRSSIWGYRMASKCYMWANKFEKAEKALEMANSIEEKLEPSKDLGAGVPLFKPFKKGEKSEKEEK